MGLDMYFTARQYLSSWNDADKELKTKVSALVEGMATEWEVKEVSFEVAYWRKANAIHNWFVQNVQEGEDDCKSYYVNENCIIELYDTVCQVLEDHSKAEELLPPQGGFFFGGTEIDEWYFKDLEYTREVFEPLVTKIMYAKDYPNERHDIWNYDFYYQSSW